MTAVLPSSACTPVSQVLSAHEVEANRSLQADEVLALSSIFQAEFSSANAGHIQTLGNSSLEDSRASALELKVPVDCSSAQVWLDFRPDALREPLEYLAPLTLQWSYPASYPSRDPPEVELQCDWLHPSQLLILRQKLDTIFRENMGEVVVYLWHDFLTHNVLSTLELYPRFRITYLGKSSGKVQPTAETEDNEVAASMNGMVGAATGVTTRSEIWKDEDIREVHLHAEKLMQFDEEESERHFLRSEHTCELCYAKYLGSSFKRIGCGHRWCESCLTRMAEVYVPEGSVERLRCPFPNCGEPMQESLVMDLVSEEMYEKYQQFVRKREIEKLEGVKYCPRCDPSSSFWDSRGHKKELCKNWLKDGSCKFGSKCRFLHQEELPFSTEPVVCLPDTAGDSLYICPRCAYNFCGDCLQSYHPGVACLSEEDRAQLAVQQAEMRMQQQQKGCSLANQIKRWRQEIETARMLAQLTQACPGCGIGIEKTGGCNHMHCCQCDTHFCWACTKILTGNVYDHFQAGKCTIFSDDDIHQNRLEERRVQRFVAGHQEIRQQIRRGLMERGRHAIVNCPGCKAVFERNSEGQNNHVTCSNCMLQFCFLCKVRLRKGAGGHWSRSHPQHGPAPPQTRAG